VISSPHLLAVPSVTCRRPPSASMVSWHDSTMWFVNCGY